MKIQFIIFTAFVVIFDHCLCQSDTPWIGKSRDGVWPKIHQRFVNQTLTHRNEIQMVFIGDSITERWITMGKKLWEKYYVPRHAFNYGIGGDRVENVVYRIENKEFDGLNPKVVVLKIGTNNLGSDSKLTASDVAKGIQKIIELLEVKMPSTPILLLGILPRGGKSEIKVQEVNQLISKFGDNKKVYYLDMSDHFQTAPGKPILDLYLEHSVHLTEKGYQVWHDVMEPVLTKIIAK